MAGSEWHRVAYTSACEAPSRVEPGAVTFRLRPHAQGAVDLRAHLATLSVAIALPVRDVTNAR